MPLESVTFATRGLEKAEPTVAVWPDPEDTAMACAVAAPVVRNSDCKY